MAQPILKRRLNPLLLISTVAALSLLAGVSVIAQDQISEANQNASRTLSNLKEIQSELKGKEQKIQRMEENISSKKTRIERLESNISNLEGNLDDKTEEIESLKEEMENKNHNIDGQTIDEMNQTISYLCLSGVDWVDFEAVEFHCEEKWGQDLGSTNES